MANSLSFDHFAASYVANGGNASQAAITAGYSPKSSRQIGQRLTKNPTVQRMIREEQHRLIGGRLCSKALAVLEQIMDDADAPYGARVDAAKTLLDRGGIPAIPAAMLGAGRLYEADKEIAEMTREELQRFVASGQIELARINAEVSEQG